MVSQWHAYEINYILVEVNTKVSKVILTSYMNYTQMKTK